LRFLVKKINFMRVALASTPAQHGFRHLVSGISLALFASAVNYQERAGKMAFARVLRLARAGPPSSIL
jgi:hypothetical protein